MGFASWIRKQIGGEETSARKRELKRLKLERDRAKAEKRTRTKAARASCAKRKERAKERAKAHAERARERARAEKRAILARASESCATDRKRIRDDAAARAHAERKRREEIARERRDANRAKARAKPLSSARERAAENDDAVRSNIDPALVPVFNRVRRNIKGTPNRSRSEEFEEYVQENPNEVVAMQQDAADAWVARMVREERRRA